MTPNEIFDGLQSTVDLLIPKEKQDMMRIQEEWLRQKAVDAIKEDNFRKYFKKKQQAKHVASPKSLS
ncbi:MAG: hypothetical protein ACM3JI_01800 [Anaerolineae bacterium]